MKLIIGLAVIIIPFFSLGQGSVKPLTIGDKVPDIAFSHVINYKGSNLKLSDFKGRLVILDFWASTCMSCVYGMPKSDSLQQRFKDSIQIVLVNPAISRDSLNDVNALLQKFITKRGITLHLPIAIYDTAAFAHFPFRFLPNYVWIGSDGIVKAITGWEEVTTQNISALLANKTLHLPVKKDWKN